ncbi:beta-ketoacyl synthase [Marinicellulosiphila megalodicopiae]|uniref:beta-ketoacyl synthase n=1 Tax=Marinicellulosiphila megalodicopiae TaxID=2724896 RepID=UPI003BAFA24C
MSTLPVIVSLGGISSAGRSSFHHAFKRIVSSALDIADKQDTYLDLAQLMGLDATQGLTDELVASIEQGTLVRKIGKDLFDVDHIYSQKKAQLTPYQEGMTFTCKTNQLPKFIPDHWQVTELNAKESEVLVTGKLEVMIPDTYKSKVSSGGQLPSGYNPGAGYKSLNHPRGLQMTVQAASDAILSLGIDWKDILEHINPDQISTYAGSALAQVDDSSLKGQLQAQLMGGRVSSKQMALSLAEMPADFINSYIINSVGSTGTNMGACASFLYNLRQGMMDIQSGQAKVAIVGNAEAALVPELMEGFRAMSALAEDDQIAKLDDSDTCNNRRACRPFSTNAGFTMAESAQFVVLMDDELAIKLGANILGSVADVFVNADANKKSISAPGIGNYVTVAKACALAKQIVGDASKTFVQAHGTGTPQNRVTESHILNEVAKTFEIESWPVCAIKSYVGHSLGAAAGDQIMATLGAWQYGILPGIESIDHIAGDVHQSNLDILMEHKQVNVDEYPACVVNSKGFGGNNATALLLSPNQTLTMLAKKYGDVAIGQYSDKNLNVLAKSKQYDTDKIAGIAAPIYEFGQSVMSETDVLITQEGISLSEFTNQIRFNTHNPYSDYS